MKKINSISAKARPETNIIVHSYKRHPYIYYM